MTISGPEFKPPSFDFNEVEATDAPAFSKPDSKAARPRWGGATKKAAESKPVKGRTSKPRVSVPPSKPGQFVEDITAMYAAVGMAVSMKNPAVGVAIVESGERAAEQWDKIAQSNDAVRRALFALTKTTAFGALAAAHAPIIMAIMAPKLPADDDNENADQAA